MSDPKGIPSHRQFVDSVSSARLSDFADRPSLSVDNSAAFEEMQNHILGTLSSGIEVQNSFVDEHGQVFDCIPIEQQISLKQKDFKLVKPDNLKVSGSKSLKRAKPAQSLLSAGRPDKFGNEMHCPENSIPIRRVTLEEMTRFGSVKEFFRKTPIGHGRHPHLSPPEIGEQVHKYSHAYQDIANLGGHSFINIWDAGGSPIQTVECGWQVFPQKYQTTKPVLFVYWTADEYNQTGAYNLDAPGFVQTSNNWALGAALATLSSDGGQQYELEITWQLIDGNWWLYINGTNASDAVGYYPTSLYNSGQMASNATDIDYGGEVVNQTFWPPMGSGAFAAAGYVHAAYFRDIYYFDLNREAQQPNLTPVQSSVNCYTISDGTAGDPWSVYFYFGGPGGSACQ